MPNEVSLPAGVRRIPPLDANSLLRVLVIDDRSHVPNWVREVLAKLGITEVTDAADGRDAFAAVTQPGAWFELILCDLRMPERWRRHHQARARRAHYRTHRDSQL